MKAPKILINPHCLDMLIASAVEVCPRETNGLLIGRTYNGNVSVKMAYPFQTDTRKPSSVEHGNMSALNRLLDAFNTMGRPLIGGFHSHPYPNGHTKLTNSDVDFIEEEMSRVHKLKDRHMPKWIELVLSVKKKDYEKLFTVGRHTYNGNGGIRVVVRTGNYVGFDVRIAAYALSGNGGGIEKTKAELHIVN